MTSAGSYPYRFVTIHALYCRRATAIHHHQQGSYRSTLSANESSILQRGHVRCLGSWSVEGRWGIGGSAPHTHSQRSDKRGTGRSSDSCGAPRSCSPMGSGGPCTAHSVCTHCNGVTEPAWACHISGTTSLAVGTRTAGPANAVHVRLAHGLLCAWSRRDNNSVRPSSTSSEAREKTLKGVTTPV